MKNAFKGVVLELSGGIDSALVLTIAVDAPGKENVKAVMKLLSTEFSGYSADTMEENLQSRCQGILLMAISNKKIIWLS